MKKSITVIGHVVDHAYVIRDVDLDKITLEKYSVECRTNIESAWGSVQGQITFSDEGDKTLEIVLKDKISNVTLFAKSSVIEMAAKMGGKIIKDIQIDRKKRGKKVYIYDLELFKEVHQQTTD
jgi:hypothetical protein